MAILLIPLSMSLLCPWFQKFCRFLPNFVRLPIFATHAPNTCIKIIRINQQIVIVQIREGFRDSFQSDSGILFSLLVV